MLQDLFLNKNARSVIESLQACHTGQHMGVVLLRPHWVPVFQDLCVSLQPEDVHAGMLAGKQKTEDWLLLSY